MALSDAELIAGVLAHDDHEAFRELVLRHQSGLRAWLRQLTRGDYAWADDLAQETFVTAYRQLKSFRAEGKFSSWLFAIAHRRFCSEARARREFATLDEVPAESFSDLKEPSFDLAEGWDDLARGLASLTTAQRTAITLCYQQGLTHEEAAAVLDCALGTLKTNILRGKGRLLRYFQRQEAAH